MKIEIDFLLAELQQKEVHLEEKRKIQKLIKLYPFLTF